MAKKAIENTDEKKRGNYDEKLVVNGSFMDIIKASVKHAKKHSAPKQRKAR